MTQQTLISINSHRQVIDACRPHKAANRGSDRFPQLDDASIDHLFQSFDDLSAKRTKAPELPTTHTKHVSRAQADFEWLAKMLPSHHGKSVAA